MSLVVISVSAFGSIGGPAQAFIDSLTRRACGVIPFSLSSRASWATPDLGSMVRMALGHAARRGAAEQIARRWRRESPEGPEDTFSLSDSSDEATQTSQVGGFDLDLGARTSVLIRGAAAAVTASGHAFAFTPGFAG